jgi:hypothetical protein
MLPDTDFVPIFRSQVDKTLWADIKVQPSRTTLCASDNEVFDSILGVEGFFFAKWLQVVAQEG